jgi:hypothetical protein
LEGGFKEFYAYHPEQCSGNYVMMADKNFKEDCKEKYSRTKKLFKQYSCKEASKRLL